MNVNPHAIPNPFATPFPIPNAPRRAASDFRRGPSNGLGVAGFIVSLLGFFASCGLLSPVGLLLSLIALRKRPRGFAVAGVVVGFIGSLWMFAAIALGLVATVLAAVGIGAASHAIEESNALAHGMDQTRQAMVSVESGLIAYQRDQGRPAYDLELLRPTYLPEGPTLDGWGHPLRVELQADGGYLLRSDGPDGVADTADDVRSAVAATGARADHSKRPTGRALPPARGTAREEQSEQRAVPDAL